MKYSNKVLIEKEKDSDAPTPQSRRRNPHAVANVNQSQGPRTGNAGAHAGKRGNFKTAKEARAPLADFVERAFAHRGEDDRETIKPGLEPVSADSRRQFKK